MVEAENQRNGTAGVNGKCRILADVLVKIIRVAPNGKHRVQMKVSLKKDGGNEEKIMRSAAVLQVKNIHLHCELAHRFPGLPRKKVQMAKRW